LVLRWNNNNIDRTGIERKDALGRVVHFHSFWKTWQTLGVRNGINQGVAQEVLGHSDANLTAKNYTDVPALALHSELAKLPWIGDGKCGALMGAQNPGVSGPAVSLADVLLQLQALAQPTGTEGIIRSESLPGTSGQFLKCLPGLGSNQD